MIDVAEIVEESGLHLRIEDIPGADDPENRHTLPLCIKTDCVSPAPYFVQVEGMSAALCAGHTDEFYLSQEWNRISIVGNYVYRLQDVLTKMREYHTEARSRARQRAVELHNSTMRGYRPSEAL